MQRVQREAISEVSLTRSPSRFVGVLRLPRLRTTRFHGGGLPDGRTWRERVLFLKHRRCNETKEYHRAQQSPHENDWLPGNENIHGRPPGRRAAHDATIVPPKPTTLFRDPRRNRLVCYPRPDASTNSLPNLEILTALAFERYPFGCVRMRPALRSGLSTSLSASQISTCS
jgi:hypothetical protein